VRDAACPLSTRGGGGTTRAETVFRRNDFPPRPFAPLVLPRGARGSEEGSCAGQLLLLFIYLFIYIQAYRDSLSDGSSGDGDGGGSWGGSAVGGRGEWDSDAGAPPPPPYCCPYPCPYCTLTHSLPSSLPTVAPTRVPTVHSLTPSPPPSLLLPLPVSLLYTHSLPPYCCPYPCPYCTLTPSLPRRWEGLGIPVLLRDEWGAARGARGARRGGPDEVDLREVGEALEGIAEAETKTAQREAESAGVEGDSGDEWVVGRAPVAGGEEVRRRRSTPPLPRTNRTRLVPLSRTNRTSLVPPSY